MKPIDRIAIVGAGAMGAAYASLIKKIQTSRYALPQEGSATTG